MCDWQRLRPACAYAQSDQSLCYSLGYSMTVKLLTGQRLEFLSLKGGCTGWSESTFVKRPHCWKSHVAVQIRFKSEPKKVVDIMYMYLVPSKCQLLSNYTHLSLRGHFILKFTAMCTMFCIVNCCQSKEKGKNQESIQSSIKSTHILFFFCILRHRKSTQRDILSKKVCPPICLFHIAYR